MADTDDRRDFTGFATLVDRTGRGGAIRLTDGREIPGEIWYDHVPIPIKKEFIVAPRVAEFIFGRSQQQMVHTTDGDFVRRLGIKECSNALLDAVGPEAADCSPITVDLARIEGWDAESADPNRATATVKTAPVPTSALRERQGSSVPTTGGPER